MADSKKVKIIVNRKFKDKKTKRIYEIGEVVDVTRARYNEIRRADVTLVQLCDDPDDAPTDGDDADAESSPENAGAGDGSQGSKPSGDGTVSE